MCVTYLYSIHLKEVVDEVLDGTEDGAISLLLGHPQEEGAYLVRLHFDPFRATMVGLKNRQEYQQHHVNYE